MNPTKTSDELSVPKVYAKGTMSEWDWNFSQLHYLEYRYI